MGPYPHGPHTGHSRGNCVAAITSWMGGNTATTDKGGENERCAVAWRCVMMCVMMCVMIAKKHITEQAWCIFVYIFVTKHVHMRHAGALHNAQVQQKQQQRVHNITA